MTETETIYFDSRGTARGPAECPSCKADALAAALRQPKTRPVMILACAACGTEIEVKR